MILVRLASVKEAEFWARPGYTTIVYFAFEGDRRVGEVCLSYHPDLGQVIISGTQVRTDDQHCLSQLWFAARTHVRQMGKEKLQFMINDDTPPEQVEMWKRLGAKPVVTVWELDV